MEQAPVRLLWSLAGSGLGTTLTANGNSGGWSSSNPNLAAALDLRFVDDLAVMVSIAAVSGTTPTLNVQLDVFDDQGNLFTGMGKFAASLTTFGAYSYSVGKHNATQVVLPMWGRVSWAVGGTTPSFSGVQISVFGR